MKAPFVFTDGSVLCDDDGLPVLIDEPPVHPTLVYGVYPYPLLQRLIGPIQPSWQWAACDESGWFYSTDHPGPDYCISGPDIRPCPIHGARA